ncbi:hypothetical protein DRQ16_00205 [bacterium]|nr:MAG: hypothetical protein DRQ16_00205 [bacterium]
MDEGFSFFTVEDLCRLFGIKPNYGAQVVFRMKGGGYIKEVEKGKYIVSDVENEECVELMVGVGTVAPSYISFRTALEHYDLCEKKEDEVYVATPKRKNTLEFENTVFKFVTIKPYKFFGYHREEKESVSYTIADIEKAILDSMEQVEYGVGMENMFDVLERALPLISLRKLIEYAVRFREKSLVARLGYILEQLGIKIDVPEELLPRGFIKLDPSGERKGKWNPHWRIIDNL